MGDTDSGDAEKAGRRKVWSRLRLWALLIPLLALVLLLALRGWTGDHAGVVAWAAAYLAYATVLEVVRRGFARQYDRPVFGWIRILANIALITWLLGLSQDAAIVLWPLYLIPIMTCTASLADGRATLLTSVVAALAFWGVAFWWPAIPLLSVLQGIAVLVVLAVLALQSWWLVRSG